MVERRYWLSKTVTYIRAKVLMIRPYRRVLSGRTHFTFLKLRPTNGKKPTCSAIFETVYLSICLSVIRADSFIPRIDTEVRMVIRQIL